ncbi:MAG: hypothetical protein JSV65_19155 [Armatimonadota bacterium]|nr:MAG: hypothetical protein JSV65_19155 [Armatimonadota bacterium]
MNRAVIAGLLAAIGVVCPTNTALSDTGSLAGRLQLMVDLDTCVWAPGNYMPRALIVLTNVSVETVVFGRPTAGPRAANTYDANQWLIMTDPQAELVPSDEVGIIADSPAGVEWVPTVTLTPGESHSYFLSLIWWGYDFAELNPMPGTYAVQAVYEYFDVSVPVFYDEDERRPWMDENHQLLFSNVVELAVLEQGAKAPGRVQLARDGTTLGEAVPRILVRGSLMADARVFTETGANLTQESGTATIARGDRRVTLPIGQWPKEMQSKHLPAIPSMGGGLLVPVRHVAESLGMRVHWDPRTKTANILTG